MKPLSNIMLLTDFSERSKQAAAYAAYLCEKMDAKLRVLHVVEVDRFVSYGPEMFWPVADSVKTIKEAALAEMDRFVKTINGKMPISKMVECARGSTEELIRKDAIANKADLIVMATHGRTGLDRVLLGSVADRVIRTAPCPVFVVREAKA